MSDTLELPQAVRDIIADVAGQSPLVAQWLSGWLAGKEITATQARLVVTAAELVVDETGA